MGHGIITVRFKLNQAFDIEHIQKWNPVFFSNQLRRIHYLLHLLICRKWNCHKYGLNSARKTQLNNFTHSLSTRSFCTVHFHRTHIGRRFRAACPQFGTKHTRNTIDCINILTAKDFLPSGMMCYKRENKFCSIARLI